MNLVVELEVRLAFACCMVARHAFVGALKLVEVAFAHALRGQFASVALDPRNCLEQVENVFDRQFANASPAARQEVNEPFGREQLGRLANWRARDLQNSREVSVMQPLSRCELPFDNHVAQSLKNSFMERFWPCDRRDRAPFRLAGQCAGVEIIHDCRGPSRSRSDDLGGRPKSRQFCILYAKWASKLATSCTEDQPIRAGSQLAQPLQSWRQLRGREPASSPRAQARGAAALRSKSVRQEIDNAPVELSETDCRPSRAHRAPHRGLRGRGDASHQRRLNQARTFPPRPSNSACGLTPTIPSMSSG